MKKYFVLFMSCLAILGFLSFLVFVLTDADLSRDSRNIEIDSLKSEINDRNIIIDEQDVLLEFKLFQVDSLLSARLFQIDSLKYEIARKDLIIDECVELSLMVLAE